MLVLAAAVLAPAAAQPVVIDGVVAVVSTEPVLYSDLAVRIDEAKRSGEPGGKSTACAILENLLFEKLLLEQSRIDSVTVDAAQVDA
jgi:peptidyl-prolyl cis-trans isomerase SurA